MDAPLPLIGHLSEPSVVAWRRNRAINAGRFLADVHLVASRLPPGRHLLNACTDRYRFAVGLCAALLAGKVSVLPSTQTPDLIRWLIAFDPDTHCLTDDPDCSIALPRLIFPDEPRPPSVSWQVPVIESTRTAAIVFTSGSTGTPVPHFKTWGRLVQCVQGEARRLGLSNTHPPAILGTVPPQHMYGFETTVLLPLQSGAALCAEKPFFPADIAAALACLPQPRWLVTTPVHLRALLHNDSPLPAVDRCISATAPLHEALARQSESALGAPLFEIFGSTETGQIATRRPSVETRWHLWPDVHLQLDGDQAFAQGGHVEGRIAIHDIVEPLDDEHFLLHGRSTDLVNIAGKRSSLSYLNHQLNSIEGVTDGAFFLHDGQSTHTGESRVGAIVVAPGLTAQALLRELRERIEAVFLPRPLLFTQILPRNATGKLPQESLQALARSLLARPDG